MFGKTSLTNAAANVITGNADKNLKPYTKEQETEARELAQMAKESYNRKAKEDGSSKLAQEMFGNPFDDEDAYKQYLPKYYDDNAIARTVQGIGAGGQNFLKGLAGNKLKQADEQTRLDTKEENVEDALAEAEFLDRLTGESMGRTPQSMYDRLVMNAVSNGLSNLQTSALISAAGLPVGGKLARGVGLANMANNSYGNAYADVRLGNKGEQYANDIDAANRYALANAGNELAQEALGLIPTPVGNIGYVQGAEIPGLEDFGGEFIQEGFGAVLDPMMDSFLEYDPIKQNDQWRNAVSNAYAEKMQNPGEWAKEIGQAGFEGGISGAMGGATPYITQTARQVGTDVNTIANRDQIRNAVNTYDTALAEEQTAKAALENAKTDKDKAFAKSNYELKRNELESVNKQVYEYLRESNAMRSSITSIRNEALRLNRSIMEHDYNDVSKRTLDTMVKASELLGVPVRRNRSDEKRSAYTSHNNARSLTDGEIRLKQGTSEDAVVSSFSHELMHAIEETDSYYSLIDSLKKLEKARIITDDKKKYGTEHYANLLSNLITSERGIETLNQLTDEYYPASYLLNTVKNGIGALRGDKGAALRQEVNKASKDFSNGLREAPYNSNNELAYDSVGLGIPNSRYKELGNYTTPMMWSNDQNKLLTKREAQRNVEEAAKRKGASVPAQNTNTQSVFEDEGIRSLSTKDLDLISQAIEANDEIVDDDLKDRLVNQFGYDELADASLDDIWDMYVDHQNGQTEAVQAEEIVPQEPVKEEVEAPKAEVTEEEAEPEFVGTEENKFGLDDKGLKMLSDAVKANDEQIDYNIMNQLAEAGYEGVLDGNQQQLWNVYSDYQKQADKQTKKGLSEAAFNTIVKDIFHRDTTSTVNKNAEGTRYIVGSDGVFAGSTVNDLYQSILEDITTLKNQDRDLKMESINRDLEALGINKGDAATAPVTIDELAKSILDGNKKNIDSLVNKAAGFIATENNISREEAVKQVREIADKYKANPRIAELNKMANDLKKNGGKTDEKGRPLSKTLKDLGYKVLTDMHQKVITDEYERHDAAIDEIEFGMDDLTPEERAKRSREIMVKKPEDQKINYVETSEGEKIPVQDFSHKQLEETKDEADFNKKISKKYTEETKGTAGEWGKNESNEAALEK